MKFHLQLKPLLFLILLLSFIQTKAQVGVGTNTPNASAALDVESTSKGFLPPRMTSTQRDAIVSPAIGLVIFNTTTNCLNFYIGTNWNESCGSAVGSVTALNCSSATNSGTLTESTVATGVSSSVPYTGGNGAGYSGQSIASTGVTGLTATLNGGTFASGGGSINFAITGTPSAAGIASFVLNIGSQSCTLNFSVLTVSPVYCNGNGQTTVVDVTNPSTGKIWMDRNLGATQAATSTTDVNSYGDLYQWGRRNDGHQCRSSTTTSTLSSIDKPGHGNFITTNSSPYDWRSPQNNNLWQGVNGINNPCPSGYRVPTETEYNGERLSWSQNNSLGAFGSPLKLPLAGFRYTNGSLNQVGSYGHYWTSTNVLYARYLMFISNFSVIDTDYKVIGSSIRCIKD